MVEVGKNRDMPNKRVKRDKKEEKEDKDEMQMAEEKV